MRLILTCSKQQLSAFDSTMVISNQRLDLAKTDFDWKSIKTRSIEQVDLNTDKVNLFRQQEPYTNTKTALNEILSRPVTTFFTVVETTHRSIINYYLN
jgi:hypothetical protein